MIQVTCNNQQQVAINASPDGTLDGPLRITVESGDGAFTQDPATPNSFQAVSGSDVFDPADPTSTVGITVYRVEADVRKGPEESLISEDVVLTVTPVPEAEATSLGMAAGAVTLKTPVVP